MQTLHYARKFGKPSVAPAGHVVTVQMMEMKFLQQIDWQKCPFLQIVPMSAAQLTVKLQYTQETFEVSTAATHWSCIFSSRPVRMKKPTL